MLTKHDWYSTSPEIEILKGRYEKPDTFKQRLNKNKRNFMILLYGH